jgi:hypothetical protein
MIAKTHPNSFGPGQTGVIFIMTNWGGSPTQGRVDVVDNLPVGLTGITDVLSPPELNPLGPLKQVAKFLHEYVPTRLRFKGSMVLVGQGGRCSRSWHWCRLRG